MTEVHVVGAAIRRNRQVLCARRNLEGALAGMWEFPGGKVEPGESLEVAVVREVSEELNCLVEVRGEIASVRHSYDFGDVSLTVFECTLLEGAPKASEHEEIRWLHIHELEQLDWAPADIPAVEALLKLDSDDE